MKVIGKMSQEAQEQEKDIITWIMWIISFSSAPSFKQYGDYKVFQLRSKV